MAKIGIHLDFAWFPDETQAVAFLIKHGFEREPGQDMWTCTASKQTARHAPYGGGLYHGGFYIRVFKQKTLTS